MRTAKYHLARIRQNQTPEPKWHTSRGNVLMIHDGARLFILCPLNALACNVNQCCAVVHINLHIGADVLRSMPGYMPYLVDSFSWKRVSCSSRRPLRRTSSRSTYVTPTGQDHLHAADHGEHRPPFPRPLPLIDAQASDSSSDIRTAQSPIQISRNHQNIARARI